MKKLVLTILLITLFVAAYSQQKTIDSLKKLIAAAKEDTARAMLMNKLGVYYTNSKPDSALLLAQRILQISKAAQFDKGEAIALNLEGNVYEPKGDYTKALSAYLKSTKIAERIHY